MFAARIVPRAAGAARLAPRAMAASKLPNFARTYTQQTVKKAVVPAAPKATWRQKLAAPMQSGMPQLVPFFFVNEVFFTMGTLGVMIWTFSRYILPRFVRMRAARQYLTKL